MAALTRPTQATYEVHENVTVDTEDHEDHTFCGIMFPVKCKDLLPIHHVVIHSVAVRGRLGPLTVWVSKDEKTEDATTNSRASSRRSSTRRTSSREEHSHSNPYYAGRLRSSTIAARNNSNSNNDENSRNNNNNVHTFRMHKKYWTKVYEKTHKASFHTYCELDLRSNPIILKPGEIKGIYIHSTLQGDEAIVYDNRRHDHKTYDDAKISILPGRAHVSEQVFGTRPIWGWGNSWRDHREFVGNISYGTVYKLWNPQNFHMFGCNFQNLVRMLFMFQRREESYFSKLPDDCIFYIINMCKWDWMNDTQRTMKQLKRRTIQRRKELLLLEQQQKERQKEEEEMIDVKMPCSRTANDRTLSSCTATTVDTACSYSSGTSASRIGCYGVSQEADCDDDDDTDEEKEAKDELYANESGGDASSGSNDNNESNSDDLSHTFAVPTLDVVRMRVSFREEFYRITYRLFMSLECT